MNVIIYCKGSVIPTNSTNMDIGTLSREQNKTISATRNAHKYITLRGHLKNELVPNILSDIQFQDLVGLFKNLDLVLFGDLLAGTSMVDMVNFPTIPRDLGKLLNNGGVYPLTAFIQFPNYQRGTPQIAQLGQFKILNGLYLVDNHTVNPDENNVYYPHAWYYRTNASTNEMEIHIKYVTKSEKL